MTKNGSCNSLRRINGTSSSAYALLALCIRLHFKNTGSVHLRRHAWLHTMGLSDNYKAHIEQLPFEGDDLFHPSTDDMMVDHWKKHAMAKRLNVVPQKQQAFSFTLQTFWFPVWITVYLFQTSASRPG
ncbi:hypothetical protein JRQ81_016751 [Phrynocephalus forsythii]|uniref:Uncharacterized protein n=1 Tax=Phrynocephalus forsythii TaxID=171643 RepID=A0A9Q1B1L7_9SAUR|nr:hypothetical protein JRQ81_016751 [Phrynocephalus forsythii]